MTAISNGVNEAVGGRGRGAGIPSVNFSFIFLFCCCVILGGNIEDIAIGESGEVGRGQCHLAADECTAKYQLRHNQISLACLVGKITIIIGKKNQLINQSIGFQVK